MPRPVVLAALHKQFATLIEDKRSHGTARIEVVFEAAVLAALALYILFFKVFAATDGAISKLF